MNKNTVNGMKDILPREMEIREYVQNTIKDVYKSFGFTQIETPAFESIENLTGKNGGENEKLIFKILKRGPKLNLETAKSESDVVDFGLRYDLTLPLSRFYANNMSNLSNPFKSIQIGPVWRADRPQRGRFRQFVQCDIDILGDSSNMAESELILATTSALSKLGFDDLTVRINDRRILKAMAFFAGFKEEDFENVFIILDKMDKIGLEGVKDSLYKEGFADEKISKYIDVFNLFTNELSITNGLELLSKKINSFLDDEVSSWLKEIELFVNESRKNNFKLIFDPTLVRGMNYYTGTIFEISVPGFSGSIAGGGRYDKMVEKFAGTPVPACGFSIGFERIVMLLLEQNFQIPTKQEKIAFLYEKTCPPSKIIEIFKEAENERASGKIVLIQKMNKNKKFQKTKLFEEGYDNVKEFFNN